MTITVGTFEAKTKLSELLDRVETGEDVVITRRGKAVARLTAIKQEKLIPTVTKGDILAISERFRRLPGAFSSAEINETLYDESGLPK